ncbi:MAG: hypothetical protein J6Y08_03950 [Clostridiales bacterium]|nr:hypothetical protein [Clostridiales bacterium]
MNIEERLQALASETKEMPQEMNMDRIKRRVKRRSTIRVIGTVAKVAATIFVAFSAALAIGVNSSVVFAKTVSDIPIIGNYSRLMIVRPDIKEAILEHQDLEDPINNGRLNEVSLVAPGQNTDLTLTFDSFLADEIALSGFFKLDGIFGDEGYYELGNFVLTDLDSGEVLDIIEELRFFENNGKLYLDRFYWNHPAENVSMDFDLIMTKFGTYTHSVIESYHFELHDIDITPARHIKLDRDVNVEGYDVHLLELLISESGTIITYDIPSDFQLDVLSFVIRDLDGNELSKGLPGVCEYNYMDIRHHILSSFYYADVSTIKICVENAYCSFSDLEYVRIDPGTQVATFQGREIPIEVHSSGASYADYGLPKNEYLDSTSSVLFLIPSDGLPKLNSVYHPVTSTYSYCCEYPQVTIDNIDYFVIQCPTFFVNDPDGCYYFLRGTAPADYPQNEEFEVDLS